MDDLRFCIGIGIAEGDKETRKRGRSHEQTYEERVGEMITNATLPAKAERAENTVHQ